MHFPHLAFHRGRQGRAVDLAIVAGMLARPAKAVAENVVLLAAFAVADGDSPPKRGIVPANGRGWRVRAGELVKVGRVHGMRVVIG